MWLQKEIKLKAKPRGFHLITNELIQAIPEISKINCGLLHVFIKHSSASLTINENADSDVTRDMIMEINKIVPFDDGYHHLEGNSAAHLKSSLIGVSELIPIENGQPVLGTWQGIYLWEHPVPARAASDRPAEASGAETPEGRSPMTLATVPMTTSSLASFARRR